MHYKRWKLSVKTTMLIEPHSYVHAIVLAYRYRKLRNSAWFLHCQVTTICKLFMIINSHRPTPSPVNRRPIPQDYGRLNVYQKNTVQTVINNNRAALKKDSWLTVMLVSAYCADRLQCLQPLAWPGNDKKLAAPLVLIASKVRSRRLRIEATLRRCSQCMMIR